VNYRPEYKHGWSGKSNYAQLRVDPLRANSSGELLEALLGSDGSLAPLKQRLIQQTQGNPFFLEESIRNLVETHALVGARGAYRLVKPLEGAHVPPTIQAILAARIDRLPPEEKRLLQAAAVVGAEVPLPLLQAIADQSEDDIHAGLAHLQAAEFLYEARLFPEVEYAFRHALSYQVAYNSLLQDRRRVLHARIVEMLETLDKERQNEQVERLAHHAFCGELWEKAATYLVRAGGRALSRSAHREAVQYFEQAITSLKRLPQTPRTQELSVDVRLGLRSSLFPLGKLEAGLQHLHEAERIAAELGDQRRLALILAYTSEHYRLSGHAMDAVAAAQRVQSIAEKLDDIGLAVAANYYRGSAHFAGGDYGRANEFLERTIRLVPGDRERERFGLAGYPIVMARMFWAWGLSEQGDFDQGIARGHEAVQLAEALNHPYSLAWACRALGHVYGMMGDFRHAVPPLERGIALSREWNLQFAAPTLMEILGYVHALSGRISEGLKLLEQALTLAETVGFKMYLTPTIMHLGEVRLLANQQEEARSLANRALALASEHGLRSHEAWALRLLAEIEAGEPSSFHKAEKMFRKALSVSMELGLRPLTAHCHLSLGKLALRAGQRSEAREDLATAITMWREMDVRFWFEQTETEMQRLG
jgi:tetratricopeptide (TPR) repeat protein